MVVNTAIHGVLIAASPGPARVRVPERRTGSPVWRSAPGFDSSAGNEGIAMTLWWLLMLVLLLLLVGSLPTYGYSRDWGYAPSGVLGVLLVLLLILLLMGRI
jgi:hypothetical protein